MQEDSPAVVGMGQRRRSARTGQGDSSSGGLFSVARYTANGSLDPTFGSGGTVATNPGGSAAATGVVVQSDGKSLIGG